MKCDNCKNKFRCLSGLTIPFTSWANWRAEAGIGSIKIGTLFAENKDDWVLSCKQPDLFCVKLTHNGKKFDGSPSEFYDGILFKREDCNGL